MTETEQKSAKKQAKYVKVFETIINPVMQAKKKKDLYNWEMKYRAVAF